MQIFEFSIDKTDTIKAIKSAIGPASSTPKTPNCKGRSKMSGMRKNTCRVKESNHPFSAFPIAVKKFEERSWTPFTTTINRKCAIIS